MVLRVEIYHDYTVFYKNYYVKQDKFQWEKTVL